MPQNRIRVLCTRNLDQLLINKAAEKNIFIDAVPFIETEAVKSKEIQNTLDELSGKKIMACFTSSNAAEAVLMQLKKNIDWKIFCTGGATKELIKKYIPESSIIASARNASLLAEKIIHIKPEEEIYFFCGDQRLNDLPETLKANNIRVNEFIVYKTILTPHLADEDYNGIMFFSPSAVHSFFSANTIPLHVVLFAIGNTTANAVHTYCINHTIVSEWPGVENLTSAVMNYYENLNQE